MAKLFVGNLTWSATAEEVQQLFASVGIQAQAEVAVGRNGRSRGYAVATVSGADDAQRAIGALNEQDFQGRNLIVRENREPQPKQRAAPVASEQKQPVNDLSVFVGNLSWNTTNEDLQQEFASYNPETVEVQVSGNRSRGWALLTFYNAQDAQNAIANMDGATVDGREVSVRADKGKPARKQRVAQPAPRREAKQRLPADSLSVFVGNLSWDTTDEDLAKEFATYNPKSATVQYGRNNKSRGWAMLTFYNEQDVDQAVADMNGAEIDGRPVNVRRDRGAAAPAEVAAE